MSSRMRVAQHRKQMKEEGYRLLQIWVPDRTNEKYLADMKREYASINKADEQDDIMEWLDNVSGWIWEESE
ncbi:antitoxin MazE-like protein [Aurantimicrobium minutum]|uniref:antitoxin MazE-like protein n=1 Tax=Aurantimicrobium minutum TaxID=708131 RepID=UPI002476940B|nr:antitoxin MazE-like protein [Aurantimicrobium minutum]MDH6422986.1 ribosomal protein L3 [Aurantimicrobium minutum]